MFWDRGKELFRVLYITYQIGLIYASSLPRYQDTIRLWAYINYWFVSPSLPFKNILVFISKCYNYGEIDGKGLWVAFLLSKMRKPNSVTHHVKISTCQTFSIRERVHKRRLKEVVKEFSMMCRGIHGTAYAATWNLRPAE